MPRPTLACAIQTSALVSRTAVLQNGTATRQEFERPHANRKEKSRRRGSERLAKGAHPQCQGRQADELSREDWAVARPHIARRGGTGRRLRPPTQHVQRPRPRSCLLRGAHTHHIAQPQRLSGACLLKEEADRGTPIRMIMRNNILDPPERPYAAFVHARRRRNGPSTSPP